MCGCNDKLTPFAPSNVVVQQGDSLSPTLLFINDLLSVLRNETDGATIGDVNLNCFLFADDLVLLSNSK